MIPFKRHAVTWLAVSMLAVVGPSCSSGALGPSDAEIEAKAQQVVAQQFANADFGSDSPVITREAGRFVVTGKVTRKGAGGTTTPRNYYCKLRYTGSGQWMCETLEITSEEVEGSEADTEHSGEGRQDGAAGTP